ncbi:hypothetical protein JMN32_15200 [Fulvivirga sp. 29W222]|uniref:Uncharacterized protein n=1 Tax=Fulvivirga marina TaxID=2494733 RepID=A0A937KEZ2_9BACT|nr:hypothetical protein [Fulvivirga marina]MBL6447663.1 hypothetical protein [Fulvivirga marina]
MKEPRHIGEEHNDSMERHSEKVKEERSMLESLYSDHLEWKKDIERWTVLKAGEGTIPEGVSTEIKECSDRVSTELESIKIDLNSYDKTYRDELFSIFRELDEAAPDDRPDILSRRAEILRKDPETLFSFLSRMSHVRETVRLLKISRELIDHENLNTNQYTKIQDLFKNTRLYDRSQLSDFNIYWGKFKDTFLKNNEKTKINKAVAYAIVGAISAAITYLTEHEVINKMAYKKSSEEPQLEIDDDLYFEFVKLIKEYFDSSSFVVERMEVDILLMITAYLDLQYFTPDIPDDQYQKITHDIKKIGIRNYKDVLYYLLDLRSEGRRLSFNYLKDLFKNYTVS